MNLDEAVCAVGVSDVYMGKWRKSPEESWEPASSRGSQPGVVLEVGLTESARQLSLCARG